MTTNRANKLSNTVILILWKLFHHLVKTEPDKLLGSQNLEEMNKYKFHFKGERKIYLQENILQKQESKYFKSSKDK